MYYSIIQYTINHFNAWKLFLRQCTVSFQKCNSTGTDATRNFESKNAWKCRTSTGFLKPHKISNSLQLWTPTGFLKPSGDASAEHIEKKINKFYLKSPIPPLLCTTACRITFNDEDFCIFTKNQQISKARHAPRSLSHAKEWHRLPRSMSAHQILQDSLMHNQLVFQGAMKISRRFLSSLILWLSWLPMQPATKRVYHILHQKNNPKAPNKPILLDQLMDKNIFSQNMWNYYKNHVPWEH